jgi:hypothetical protein
MMANGECKSWSLKQGALDSRGWFFSWSLLVCLILGCASAPRPSSSPAPSISAATAPNETVPSGSEEGVGRLTGTAPLASEFRPAPSGAWSVALSPPETAPGTLVLLTLDGKKLWDRIPAASDPGVGQPRKDSVLQAKGEFAGITFPFYPAFDRGEAIYEAVLGIPYERPLGLSPVRITLEGVGIPPETLDVPLQIIEGHYPSEVLRVDGRRVKPRLKKDLIRIQKEQAQLNAIYQTLTPQKFWKGPFELPIPSVVTSAFGTRRVYNGTLKNYHTGMDLRAAMNTPIYAAASGKVVLAQDLFFTGNTVMIDHGWGLITIYAHMNRLQVQPGQWVEKKTLLGLSGATGRVNGPHLHWQAVIHHVKVNPKGLLEVLQ